MTCSNSECVGDIDFECIAFYAHKRFIEGVDTLTLMAQANSERDKYGIALAALLDLDDSTIRELKLFVCDNNNCKAKIYRRQLQQMFSGIQVQAAGF